MKKYITLLITFLGPILGKAFLQTAADELAKAAYPPTDRRRYSSYNRYNPSRYNRVGENPFTRNPEPRGYVKGEAPAFPYHDVLMVAFDITGPNMDLAKDFILNYMPEVGRQTFKGQTVNLDSFWIADDKAGDDDTDSAVFVTKGKQAEARELLRRHGLVD